MTERAPDAWLVSLPYYGVDTHGNQVGKHTSTLRHPAWNPGVGTHNAEPLYTIPNALRAMAQSDETMDRMLQWLGKVFDGSEGMQDALMWLADELEAPADVIPPEPEGDVIVKTVHGELLERNGSRAWLIESGRGAASDWREAWKHFGPLKVYRAES